MAATPVSNTLEAPVSWFGKILGFGRQTLLVQGIKTGLAAGLCYWLSLHFGMHEGYWSAISAIIVLQSNVGSTVTASRDRFIGTAIGAVLGFLASPWRRHPAAFAVTILVALVLCGLLNLKNSSRLAGVTITIVMLVDRNGSHWTIAPRPRRRSGDGHCGGLAVSFLVLPRRARQHLRIRTHARNSRRRRACWNPSPRALAAHLPDEFQVNKDAVDSLVRSNEQLLRAARNEPASGPASIEGLSLLSEFGRSIFDALLALELAVRKVETILRGAPEPRASRTWSSTSAHGFKHLAECMTYWRFDIRVPASISRSDIAALKAKVLRGPPYQRRIPTERGSSCLCVPASSQADCAALRAARHEALDATGGQDR